ncbi:MAG TPA: hypothetical protein VGE77_08730 [Nocardioides sp.]
MTDPELTYQRVTTGDAGTLAGTADTMRFDADRLWSARTQLGIVEQYPEWTGSGAVSFHAEIAAMVDGLTLCRNLLLHGAGAIDVVVGSLETTATEATAVIQQWRERPTGLPPVLETTWASVTHASLAQIGNAHNETLATVAGVLAGEEPADPSTLDEATREWLENGQERTEEWLEQSGSELGPLIPNTAATGDPRGWIPQGLGYAGAQGLLLQSYYTKDGSASIALIDEATGTEVNELYLTGPGGENPGHVGGVTVQGDQVHVASNGKLYTYDLDELQNAPSGSTVASGEPTTFDHNASYTAFKDGLLYVGDFSTNTLHVYRQEDGEWVPERRSDGSAVTYPTPPESQGVVVRDGEFVFSSSHGRENGSSLVVQDHDGNVLTEYELPNMSQNVVEVDGEIITTYESGAEEFDRAKRDSLQDLLAGADHGNLWPMTHMTRTSLEDLGLSPDGPGVQIVPESLTAAADALREPTDLTSSVAASLAGLRVHDHQLGDHPAAPAAAQELNELLEVGVTSLRTGLAAMQRLGEALVATAADHTATDEGVALNLDRLTPW